MNKSGKKTFKLASVTLMVMMSLLAACTSGAPTSFCHATDDAANPYEEITIDSVDLKVHLEHPNDIYPVPEGGCPTSPVVVNDGKITICHATGSDTNPYNEVTVSVSGLNGHGKHEGDLFSVPEGGCPASPESLEGSLDGKITICHATSSKKNAYNEITVSVNGLNGHDKHTGDIVPAPVGGCPTSQ